MNAARGDGRDGGGVERVQSAETRVETQLALVGAHDAAVRDGKLVQKVRDGGGGGV